MKGDSEKENLKVRNSWKTERKWIIIPKEEKKSKNDKSKEWEEENKNKEDEDVLNRN